MEKYRNTNLLYLITIFSIVLLLGCQTQSSSGKALYEDAMLSKKDRLEKLKLAKNEFLNAIYDWDLGREEKIYALSVIARAYMEEVRYEDAEMYIKMASELIDPNQGYEGDKALIGIIVGDYFFKAGKENLNNIEEKHRAWQLQLKEEALKYFDEALVNYFLAERKSGNPDIESYFDLRKLNTFLEKARIYRSLTYRGRREMLERALASLNSAMEIIRNNSKPPIRLLENYKSYEKLIESMSKEIEQALKDER